MKKEVLVLLAVFFSVQHLHGYIDPGTGSFVFQLLIAGLAGALYAVKVFWRQIKAFFVLFLKKKK